jgi:two-component system nitrate/nitrite response regulator NarL
MAAAEIRVAVLAQPGLVSDALVASIAAQQQFRSVGVFDPGAMDLPLRLGAGRPDVVVVSADAVSADLAGFLKEVRRAVPRTPAVIIGGEPDVSTAVAAVRAGAVAWCDGSTSAERLFKVLAGVHRGEAWFPPRLLGATLRALTSEGGGRANSALRSSHGSSVRLSRRESAVFDRLAGGASTEDIAREFGISVNTVRSYARRAMGKVGPPSIPRLMRLHPDSSAPPRG